VASKGVRTARTGAGLDERGRRSGDEGGGVPAPQRQSMAEGKNIKRMSSMSSTDTKGKGRKHTKSREGGLGREVGPPVLKGMKAARKRGGVKKSNRSVARKEWYKFENKDMLSRPGQFGVQAESRGLRASEGESAESTAAMLKENPGGKKAWRELAGTRTADGQGTCEAQSRNAWKCQIGLANIPESKTRVKT